MASEHDKLEQVIEACNDTLESASMVKGSHFAVAAGHLCEVLQLTAFFNFVVLHAGFDNEQSASIRSTASRLLCSIADGLGADLSPDELAEAEKLAETMTQRLNAAIFS